MERQTFRKIYLAATGLKLTGLVIYGAIHGMSGSGSVPHALATPPVIQSGSQAVDSMFDQFDGGIPMIGPKGQSILVRDPDTGAFRLIPATPTAMSEP